MGTLSVMHDTIEATDRLVDAIREAAHAGQHADARDRAVLLVRVLEGAKVPCCIQCGLALSDEEIDRYISWCAEDAPMLDLRFEP